MESRLNLGVMNHAPERRKDPRSLQAVSTSRSIRSSSKTRSSSKVVTAEDVVAAQAAHINTWEYREKNFAREALTVNPAKACQPLGAVFAAAGFEHTLPFNHGSQGCTAYFRVAPDPSLQGALPGGLHLDDRGRRGVRRPAEHDRRPAERLSGLQAQADRRQHHLHRRSHRRRLVSAFIGKAREKGAIPDDFPVAFAHTPSFVGSHVVGYD